MIAFDDINLRENNPYSVGSIFVFVEGDIALDRDPIKVTKSFNDRYYTIVAGDEIGNIAFDYYGNSKWWWVIWDSNDIENPFELKVGNTLLIPDLNRIKATI